MYPLGGKVDVRAVKVRGGGGLRVCADLEGWGSGVLCWLSGSSRKVAAAGCGWQPTSMFQVDMLQTCRQAGRASTIGCSADADIAAALAEKPLVQALPAWLSDADAETPQLVLHR